MRSLLTFTHLLQPADVSIFRPLKQQWKTTVSKWLNQPEYVNVTITKLNFCRVLDETLKSINFISYVRNGFRKCGLYPLNPDNVDYTKCVKNILENKQQHSKTESKVTLENLEIAEHCIRQTEPKLYSYGINIQVIYNELDELQPKQHEIEVGTIIPMEAITIVPVQDIILNEPEVSMEVESEQHSQDIRDSEQSDGTVKDLVSNVADQAGSNSLTDESPEEIDGALNTKSSEMQHKKNETRSITENKQPPEELANNVEMTNNAVLGNKSSQNGENGALKTIFPSNDVLPKKIDPFEAHLKFPLPSKKSENKTPKEKLLRAISSEAWIKLIHQKEEEKKEKKQD
ncbi:unnamed protein product [Psylliodes chrysocephalus]|uniref:Uncharacterized protein n=1 Tax=Psylliodes chrysocephalus TaxID=3402493 RepID=A0A9P0CNL3_9CUCU|nr:unnamed protein product [Psylliodes chrysocephala]